MTTRLLYQPEPLEFSAEVADLILERLSFGFDAEFVWNVPGAPTEEQLAAHLVTLELPETFTTQQRANLQHWLERFK